MSYNEDDTVSVLLDSRFFDKIFDFTLLESKQLSGNGMNYSLTILKRAQNSMVYPYALLNSN